MTDVLTIGPTVIVEAQLKSAEPDEGRSASPFYQVLTLRDGRIVNMQDCASREKALRYAKQRAQ